MKIFFKASVSIITIVYRISSTLWYESGRRHSYNGCILQEIWYVAFIFFNRLKSGDVVIRFEFFSRIVINTILGVPLIGNCQFNLIDDDVTYYVI